MSGFASLYNIYIGVKLRNFRCQKPSSVPTNAKRAFGVDLVETEEHTIPITIRVRNDS